MSTVGTPVREAPARSRAGGRRVRVSTRAQRLLSVLVLLVLVTMSASQLSDVRWAAVLTGLDWTLVGAAAVATAVSILGAAVNLLGFSPVRIGLWPASLAQLAGTAIKILTPASVGTVAVNARLVQRSGASTPRAVLAVAACQAAQLAVTAVLLGVVVLLGGSDVAAVQPHVPLRVVEAVALAALLLAFTKRWWWRLIPVTATARAAEVGPQVLAVLRDPRRCVAGIGGCVLLTAGLVAALWGSIRATGGQLPMLPILVVLLAGSALGSTVPTPGGLGGVEAAMTAGLVAAGLPLAQAVPAVLLYRALTFWLLVPVGTVAAMELRRRQLL